MYAVVQLGSSQFKVSEGDIIDSQNLEGKEGKTVTLDKVLLVSEGRSAKVGQPYLKDVKITAKIIRHHLGEKTLAFKYRRRKDSSWRKGDRQKLTALSITKIAVNKEK